MLQWVVYAVVMAGAVYWTARESPAAPLCLVVTVAVAALAVVRTSVRTEQAIVNVLVRTDYAGESPTFTRDVVAFLRAEGARVRDLQTEESGHRQLSLTWSGTGSVPTAESVLAEGARLVDRGPIVLPRCSRVLRRAVHGQFVRVQRVLNPPKPEALWRDTWRRCSERKRQTQTNFLNACVNSSC